jgi:hypothetical protein
MAKKIQKIQSFDKPTCRIIGDAFHKMALEFAQQYGLTTKASGGRFDNTSFTPKVTFCVAETDAETGHTVNKKEQQAFQLNAPTYGIDPDAFGKEITLKGKKFTITGWNPKAYRSPVTIIDSNGRGFKCPTESIARQHPLKDEGPKAKLGKVLPTKSGLHLTDPPASTTGKGVRTLTELEAKLLSKKFVAYTKGKYEYSNLFTLYDKKLKKGMLVLVADRTGTKVVYKIVKISSVGVDHSGESNSKVRVSDGEASWRIDGCYILKNS